MNGSRADDDEDDLLRQLEEADDDDRSAQYREQRSAQLKQEWDWRQAMAKNGHGQLGTLQGDPAMLEATTAPASPLLVCHFFHKDFRRCQIMDRHLQALANKYYKTRFIRTDVETCPFLVTRLQVKVLPCVVCFVDAVAIDRLVGFQELGEDDDFPTPVLERRLRKSGVLKALDEDLPVKRSQSRAAFSIRHAGRDTSRDEDSD